MLGLLPNCYQVKCKQIFNLGLFVVVNKKHMTGRIPLSREDFLKLENLKLAKNGDK